MFDDVIVQKLRVDLDTQEADQKSKDFEKSFNNSITKSILAANVATKAFDTATGFLWDTLKTGFVSAMQAERGLIRFETALKASGQWSKKLSKDLQDQADSLARVANVEDDYVLQLQSQALSLGVTSDKIKETTQAALIFAQVTGVDASTALFTLSKAQDGLRSRSLQLLPALRNLTDEQLKNGDAVRILNEQYKGHLASATEGTFAELEAARRSWGELWEAVGKGVLDLQAVKGGLGLVGQEMKALEIMVKDEGVMSAIARYAALVNPLTAGWALGKAILGAQDRWQTVEDQKAADAAKLSEKVGTAQAPSGFDFAKDDKTEGLDTIMASAAAAREEAARKAAAQYKKDTDDILEDLEKRGRRAAEIFESNEALKVDLAEHYEQLIADARERRLQHQIAVTNKYDRTEQRMAKVAGDRLKQISENTYGGMAGVAGEYFAQVLAGQKASFKAMVDNFLMMSGQQLVADGVKHLLMGGIMMIPGTPMSNPAAGSALMAQAGVEIGTGTAMIGGSLAIDGGGGKGGGGGSASGGSSASDFAGGASTGGRGNSTSSSGPSTIIVNVGGVMSSRDAGREVAKAIAKSAQRGLL